MFHLLEWCLSFQMTTSEAGPLEVRIVRSPLFDDEAVVILWVTLAIVLVSVVIIFLEMYLGVSVYVYLVND